MPVADFIEEAARQLTVCNACRYCEGYCPVFPALERRAVLTSGDVNYLANLCHDCRACFQACMYTEPHVFKLNIPAAMAQVRAETYQRYAWPRGAGTLLRRTVPVTAELTGLGLVLAAVTVIATGGWGRLMLFHEAPGAFYKVVPFLLMLIPGLVAGTLIAGVLLGGFVSMWKDASGDPHELRPGRPWVETLTDIAGLRQMRGGGAGCYYPDSQMPSSSRRWLHSLVLWGFVAALLSTTLAAVWQDILRQLPPYPVVSPPVLFGIAGGLSMIIGCTGLIVLKTRSDPNLTSSRMVAIDYSFLVLLDLTSVTGMLLLILRATPAMGVLLLLHLAVLVALFATAPYGKFVHFVYRSAAILLNHVEEARPASGTI
jgi:citrate/tricarballylate utilization protein